ncbi:hypothetical protein T492DRAFT_887984 [Pavlovales sp. CCMP2436]|nr:hypothetical protein T492DRAFT_887984 [Pavlovales sp. CCMP2436]
MPVPSQELEISRLTALLRKSSKKQFFLQRDLGGVMARSSKVQQEKLPPSMIHDARMGSKLFEFEVEWDGWTNPIDFTWEPEVNLPGYADLVRDFIAEPSDARHQAPLPDLM